MSRGDNPDCGQLTVGKVLSGVGQRPLSGLMRPQDSTNESQPLLQRMQGYGKRCSKVVKSYIELANVDTPKILEEVAGDFFSRYPQLEAFGFSADEDPYRDENLAYDLGAPYDATTFFRDSEGRLFRIPSTPFPQTEELDITPYQEIRDELLDHLCHFNTELLCEMVESRSGWSLLRTRDGDVIMFNLHGEVYVGEDLEVTKEILNLY